MRIHTWLVLFAVAGLLLSAGCAKKEEPPPAPAPEPEASEPQSEPRVASAKLRFTDAFADASGTVVFSETDGGVEINAQVDYGGETRVGAHGFHLHEVGDCSAADFTSTGGHFNPTGVDHGAPDFDSHHAGDFGNIEIGEGFTGTLEMTSSMLSFDGENSVVGRGVILHAGEDDLTSQPTGAAGARDACGVVTMMGGEDPMGADADGETEQEPAEGEG